MKSSFNADQFKWEHSTLLSITLNVIDFEYLPAIFFFNLKYHCYFCIFFFGCVFFRCYILRDSVNMAGNLSRSVPSTAGLFCVGLSCRWLCVVNLSLFDNSPIPLFLFEWSRTWKNIRAISSQQLTTSLTERKQSVPIALNLAPTFRFNMEYFKHWRSMNGCLVSCEIVISSDG